MKPTEETTKDLLDLKQSVEFYLKSFDEAASVRVSKERIMEVMEMLRAKVMGGACEQFCKHPVVVALFSKVLNGVEFFISFECRTRRFGLMRYLPRVPTDLADATVLAGEMVKGFQVATLEDIHAAGVSPFELMKEFHSHLEKGVDYLQFESIKTNHPPARA